MTAVHGSRRRGVAAIAPRSTRPAGATVLAGVPPVPLVVVLLVLVLLVLPLAAGLPASSFAAEYRGQEVDSDTPWEVKRELRRESTAKRVALAPVRVVAWPFRQLAGGMESGLLYVEENHVLVRLQEYQLRMRETGIMITTGGLGSGAGVGFGLQYVPGGWRPRENHWSFVAAGSFLGYVALEVAHVRPQVLGPVGMRAAARFDRATSEDFFGLGPGSSAGDHSLFLQEELVGSLTLDVRPARQVLITSTGRVRRVVNGAGRGDHPPTRELFDPDDVPGLSTHVDYVAVEVDFAHSDVDRPGLPEPWSGRERVAWSVHEAVDGQPFGYSSVAAELVRYIPLLYGGTRQLAVRARGEVNDRREGHEAPFYDLPVLGGPMDLRGFRRERFRDRDTILFNAEYRWPVSKFNMELAAFWDEGAVFTNVDDEFRWDRLRSSYGGELRLKSPNGVVFRLTVGRSTEGWRAYYNFVSAF